MRIVITCDWFVKYAAAQTAALARAGAEVLLLCRSHSLEFSGDASERQHELDSAREAGVVIMEMPGRLWDPSVARRFASIRTRVGRFRPDVVHAHVGADPRALALMPQAPLVLTVHDPRLHPGQPSSNFQPKRWFLKTMENAWAARASAIVVHSDCLRAEVDLRRNQRCFVVPHGLEVRQVPLPPPTTPAVGFFGRFEPYKGLEVLARAMPRVWKLRPDVILKTAGAGPSILPLTDRRVQVDRRYLPEAGVEDFFAATSLAVLPYTHASQTGAGSRAVGYGVPVVASRLGGLPDLTLDQTYLFDAHDDAGLAEAILRHIDDDDSVRTRVVAEVATPRSWDAAAARSLKLYEEIM